MKDSALKDFLVVAAVSTLSYLVVKNYMKRKKAEKQIKEFIHFQIF